MMDQPLIMMTMGLDSRSIIRCAFNYDCKFSINHEGPSGSEMDLLELRLTTEKIWNGNLPQRAF